MRGHVDVATLVSGLVVIALGTVLLLDQLGELELTFGWLGPLLAAAVGAVLLASGLAQRGRRPSP